jgi:hypothetical protein
MTTDLSLTSGSDRLYDISFVDIDGNVIDLTLATNIVWAILSGRTIVKKKSLVAGEIVMIDASLGEVLIPLLALDTAPDDAVVPGIGSATKVKQYKHETRVYFVDGTQEVPENMRGSIKLLPTGTWGEA